MTESPNLDSALAALHKDNTAEELRVVYEQHTSLTIAQLAAATGRSTSWVSRQLHFADTLMRPRGWPKRTQATSTVQSENDTELLRPSSIVLRHRIIRLLVELRTRSGLSQLQAAHKVGVSHHTLMRAENPQGALTQHLLHALCTCYGALPKMRDELLRLWKGSRAPQWWTRQRLRMSGSRQQTLGLRADARRVYGWADHLVPELMQTAGYARVVEGAVGAHGPVEMAVSVLMAAQRRVRRRGIDQRYVVDEAVIRRRVGGAQVMAEQLTVLRGLAKRDRVRVLSHTRGHCVPADPFELCSVPGLEESVLFFPRSGKVHWDDSSSAYSLQFLRRGLEQAWERAEGPDATVALIDHARAPLLTVNTPDA